MRPAAVWSKLVAALAGDPAQAEMEQLRAARNTAERQWLNVPTGHWVIRGINGELYPCAPDIFEATYEEIQDQP